MDEQQNRQKGHQANELTKSTELVSGQVLKKFRWEMAITRLMCAITSILIVCLLAGGVYVLRRVQPVLDQVAAVDMENVNETLSQVKYTLENVDLQKAAETMQQAVDTMESVDLEAWNSAIDGLDTAELSKTMANLNEATESLRRVETSINSIFGRR